MLLSAMVAVVRLIAGTTMVGSHAVGRKQCLDMYCNRLQTLRYISRCARVFLPVYVLQLNAYLGLAVAAYYLGTTPNLVVWGIATL